MELMDIIKKRQSVRKFKEGAVPSEDLEKIMEAGGLAPSGKNCQNWHFLIIKNKELMEKIAQVIVSKNEAIATKMQEIDEQKALRFRKFVKNFTLFYLDAPVLILAFGKDYFPSGYQELSLIGAPKYKLDQLFQRNPGMQNMGAALENITLRAIDLGYGTCWLTSQNYAADEIEALLEEEASFSLPDHFLVAMMALGVPEEHLKSPAKKPTKDIYTLIP